MQNRWQVWLLKPFMLVLSPLLFFGVLELFAWGIGVEPLVDDPIFKSRAQIRECRWDPADVAKYCDADWYSERLQESPGRRGVFVYGGSSVNPMTKPKMITSFLQEHLEKKRPRQFKVFNLGVVCKDSIFVRSCVESTLDADPSFVVIYSGHNDFSGFRSRFPELLMFTERRGWGFVELENQLARTRAYSLFAAQRTAPIVPDADPGADLGTAALERANQVILDAYTENILSIIELAGQRGQEVVLVTIVGNQYEFPVKRRWWDSVVEEARSEGDEASPWTQSYAAGITSFRNGRLEEARDHFKVARDLDSRSRAPGLLNPRLREIAAAHSHVHLVDFERELDSVGLKEGIGCDFFDHVGRCDGVHPSVRTNGMIGRAVARKLIEIDASPKVER